MISCASTCQNNKCIVLVCCKLSQFGDTSRDDLSMFVLHSINFLKKWKKLFKAHVLGICITTAQHLASMIPLIGNLFISDHSRFETETKIIHICENSFLIKKSYAGYEFQFSIEFVIRTVQIVIGPVAVQKSEQKSRTGEEYWYKHMQTRTKKIPVAFSFKRYQFFGSTIL